MNEIDYSFLRSGAIYIFFSVSMYLNPLVQFPFGYVSFLFFICKSLLYERVFYM